MEETTPDFKDLQELPMGAGVGELGETAGAMNTQRQEEAH